MTGTKNPEAIICLGLFYGGKMEFIEIRCQEENCQYHKKNCCFGEIEKSGVKNTLIERHKCKYSKNMVLVKIIAT